MFKAPCALCRKNWLENVETFSFIFAENNSSMRDKEKIIFD
jgi:hypothetical protein